MFAVSELLFLQVPTIDGNVDLKIPAGTQPGVTLLMAKRGVPKLGAGSGVRGDQQVKGNTNIYFTLLPSYNPSV